MVESGVRLEMSILLRKRATFGDTKEICPRCMYINLNAVVCNGWIEWSVVKITLPTNN
jgi:hypothetical protein